MTGIRIRPATPDDAPALRAIERAAGERFREIGMADIADDDPLPLDALTAYAIDGRSWVAVDGDGDRPVGYVVVDVVDGAAHVEQVSVHPRQQGRGVGRALLQTVETWAAVAGRDTLTLTTFRDVPWNAPLYEHLGFRVLAEAELGPDLRALRATEAAHGLDPATRVCMSRPIEKRRTPDARGPEHASGSDECGGPVSSQWVRHAIERSSDARPAPCRANPDRPAASGG